MFGQLVCYCVWAMCVGHVNKCVYVILECVRPTLCFVACVSKVAFVKDRGTDTGLEGGTRIT